MRQPVIALAVLFVSLSPFTHAQDKLRLEVGGGASLNGLTSGVFSNWADGWTLGGGVSHPMSSSIDLTLNLTYHRYPYRGNNLELIMPGGGGLQWRAFGQASNVIETSIAFRFISSGTLISPFLSFRTGLYHFIIGKIEISTWYTHNEANLVSHSIHNTSRISKPMNIIYRSTYSGSGTSTTKGFAALGFGCFVPLDSNIRMMFEGRITQTFDSKEKFIPLLAVLQFDI